MKYLMLLAIVLTAATMLQAQQKVGQQAPDIALPGVTGEIKRLSDQTGKVVLLDFWASWCTPCRKKNPSLVKLYSKYNSKGFEIFGVSIDEDASSWKKAISADKMTWTQVLETGGWDGPGASIWKIMKIPTSYLLDQSGKIVAVDPGDKELEKKITALLNGSI